MSSEVIRTSDTAVAAQLLADGVRMIAVEDVDGRPVFVFVPRDEEPR
jgi:hypothetical protein